MYIRKEICEEVFSQYQKTDRKGKGKILDEYTKTLDCNRDYLAHLLTSRQKTRNAAIGQKTGRPEKYNQAFIKILAEIWELFDFQCGKLLAPLIRGMIAFLEIEFKLDAELRTLFETISPATIDRKLRNIKKHYRIKGIGAAKQEALLKSQIPIRVYSVHNERQPGFFEIGTVAHCGSHNTGHFCWTLTMTDAGSGWTEECALLNHAQSWVNEQVEKTIENLPFPMLGIDGNEMIDKQLFEYCLGRHIIFTRSHRYRKNDNRIVEQKNYDVVRKTVGYGRFEGKEAMEALADVYRFLNPLLNYWYPTMRFTGKEKLPSGGYKKIFEKDPKPPCMRLLESPDLGDEYKDELRRRAAALNPIKLKRQLDMALDRLLKLHVNEAYIPSVKVS